MPTFHGSKTKLDCVGLPESLMSPEEEDSVEEGGIFTPGNNCCRSFSCKVKYMLEKSRQLIIRTHVCIF
jgi:hypothetical protein